MLQFKLNSAKKQWSYPPASNITAWINQYLVDWEFILFPCCCLGNGEVRFVYAKHYFNLSWIEKLRSNVNAVKHAYCDNTRRLHTLNYLKPPEKSLPALFFPMQLWCDFLFKCLLTSVQSKWGKHSCSWNRPEDVFFFRHSKRELLWVYQENIRMPDLCILCIPQISKMVVYVTSKFTVHLMEKGVEVQREQCPMRGLSNASQTLKNQFLGIHS